MTPPIFYVKDRAGNLVAAKFLSYKGNFISDPNTSTAQDTPIFNSTGQQITNANPNGYLIVPASYSVGTAIQAGGFIQDTLSIQILGSGEGVIGLPEALASMTAFYLPGGLRDLQRTYNGVSHGASNTNFVGAFVDAASFDLGLVSAYAGMPITWPELGGGTLNVLSNSFLRNAPLDELGPYGLTGVNGNSVQAGYTFGQSLPGAAHAESDPATITAEAAADYTSANITLPSSNQVQIDVDFNNGTSQSNLFTYNSDDSSSEVTDGYSGTNLGGTLQYTQTTDTSAAGQAAAAISGTGDDATLSDAAITLAANAAATVSGIANNIALALGATVSDSDADLDTDTLTVAIANGNTVTIDLGTAAYTASQFADSGTVSVPLVYNGLVPLGTLSINTSNNTDSIQLKDGMVITLPGITSNDTITPPTNPTTTTPEEALLAYLSDLGDTTTASALESLNQSYLSSQGITAGGYTVSQFNALSGLTGTGLIDAVSGGVFNLNTHNPNADYNMVAYDWSGTTLIGNNQTGEQLEASLFGNDVLTAGNGTGDFLIAGEGVDTMTGGTGGEASFEAFYGLAPGSSVTGQGSGNLLETAGDITGSSISGIQSLVISSPYIGGNITLTASQLDGFTNISEGALINASGGGTFNLQGKTTEAYNMTAVSNTGTTLEGNGGAGLASGSGGTLTASATGNDTLDDGGTLVAGGGVDTLENGTTAIASNGLAVGSTISNVTTLETSGDLTGDTLSSIGTLALTGGDSINLKASQLSAISTFEGPAGSEFNAATGGTYDLDGKVAGGSGNGPFDMTALVNTGTTLEEDGVSGVTLTASASGNDSLISNNSSEVTLDADDSTGNVTLTSTGSGYTTLSAEDSTGNDTLTTGTGGGDNVLDVLGSTGTDTLNAGTDSFDTIYAGNGTDTISGGGTIYTGGGTDTVNAGLFTTIIEGSGTDTIYTDGGVDTITGGTGNDTYVVNVSLESGTSIAGGGGADTLEVISGPQFDISQASVTGVQTLQDNALTLKLTASELSEFTSLGYTSTYDNEGYAYLLATTAGTYSLVGKTLTGNFDLSAFYTTAGVTLIGNNQAGQILIGGLGTDTLEAGTGTGDTLYSGGGINTMIGSSTGGDTFDLTGAASTLDLSLAGDVVTFSGATEQLAFSGVDTVVVQGGTTATIVGDNGTMTVNNDASGGVVKNTINWTAGGSETEVFTSVSGGEQEDDTGYTGTNGTGTQTYSQTTTTSSGGAITASVSGTGDVSGLSDAAFTLAAGAAAYFTGSGNTIAAGELSTTNFALSTNGSLAGDVVTFNGSTEQVAFAGGNNVTVATDTEVTVVGSNGTMVINNGVGSVKENLTDWTAGGSETEVFSSVSGGTQEVDTGYTGSNGTGTVTYSQTTTTSSGGAITASISGTGDVSGISNAAITLASGASASLFGSNNTITLDSGSTANIAGSGATVSGSTVVYNGTSEQITFSDPDTVIVGSGAQATIIGPDGTMTVNNDASGGLEQNTINWTAGGSEVQNLTLESNGSVQEVDTEFSGSNGSGSTVYTQTITTTTSGAVSGAVYGSGDLVHYSNATLTLGNTASATFTGSHNTVAGGSNDTITLSGTASSDFTYFFSNCTLNDGGTNDSSIAYGNNNTINLTGTGDTTSDASQTTGDNNFVLSGSSDTATLGESGDTATVSGSGNTVGANTGDTIILTSTASSNFDWMESGETVTDGGTNDHTVLYASGDTVTVTGTHDLVTDVGTGSNTVSINGTDDTADISNAGDVTTVNGTENVAYLFDNNTTLNLDGTYNTGVAYGSDDTINVNGSNDTGNDYGTSGDQVIVDGSGDNAVITKNGDSSTIAGSNNTAEIVGTDDALTVTGNNNTVDDYVTSGGNSFSVTGAGNSVNTFNGDTITLSSPASSNFAAFGGGCTINDGGTSDSSVAYGNGNTTNLTGSNDTTTIWTGTTGNNITLTGTGDIAVDESTGSNTIALNGSTETAQVGSASDTVTFGGSNDTAYLNRSGTAITVTGTSADNRAVAYQTGDTITLAGSGNSSTIWNTSGDTINVTGTDDAAYDYGTASSTIILGGSSNTATIYNTVSDTLTVGGSGDALAVNNNITGTETATISGTSALLQFGGSTTDNIVFSTDAIGELLLNSAASFAGTVAGMTSSDSVDLANFLFSATPTISSVTGTGASGTATDVTVTDGSAHVVVALMNQFANQFAVSASAYTLKADGTGGSAGTLFEIAPGH